MDYVEQQCFLCTFVETFLILDLRSFLSEKIKVDPWGKMGQKWHVFSSVIIFQFITYCNSWGYVQ